MNKLVDIDVLAIYPRGVKNASRTTCGYIKKLPLENDTDGEQEFLSTLSEYTYEAKLISIELYRKSYELISLEAIGTVQVDVFQLLRRPEYGIRDFTILINLPKIKLNEHSNYVNIRHEKENKNLSSVGISDTEENIKLNNVNISHQESHNYLQNFFSSPVAWRTRSKSKTIRRNSYKKKENFD
ncbi:unnamed protein product [Rotaria sp. Silwood2]|nr:unnamed protein product [Rotaria sp. Silwood2]CAF2989174.1 unnamed protein product [Rotaria sp. Silwood2]CAF3405990.1 unnamed protein product [Rotaria sp. Silwood2]CAF3998460.1 unnamed protein product [Rotaria sp. Silwood2]CAF4024255.1 unnamed protein product [Rotaria sp. Silwood2]